MVSPEILEFNLFEKAILDWIYREYNDESLKYQIKQATLKEREATGGGFYLELSIPDDAKVFDMTQFYEERDGKMWVHPIDGPVLFNSQDVPDGGGALLWYDKGRITMLEIYAFGIFSDSEVKIFKLKDNS